MPLLTIAQQVTFSFITKIFFENDLSRPYDLLIHLMKTYGVSLCAEPGVAV
jgi:hypothetical protein